MGTGTRVVIAEDMVVRGIPLLTPAALLLRWEANIKVLAASAALINYYGRDGACGSLAVINRMSLLRRIQKNYGI